MRGHGPPPRPRPRVIDTDSGLVRELSSRLRSRSPRARLRAHRPRHAGRHRRGSDRGRHSTRPHGRVELHRALSRPRPDRLLIHDHQPAAERSEFGAANRPRGRARTPSRGAAADARARRRGPRDRAAPGRRSSQTTPSGRRRRRRTSSHRSGQPRSPSPAPPVTATQGRLRELRERIEQLRAQLQALPTVELQRIEDLDGRALTLTSQREQLTERLAALPQPRDDSGASRTPTPATAHIYPAC